MRNVFRANSIYSNGKGIDLGGDGATANDAHDADTGPNNFQNFATLDAVTLYVTRLFAMTVSSIDVSSGQVLKTASLSAEPYTCLVSADGRAVAARHLCGASHEAFHTYLLGQALSFALINQGFDPLHATTVTIGAVSS